MPATVSLSSPMRARGRYWCNFAVGTSRFLSEYADDHCGDVVVAAVDVRFLDEGVDDALRFGARKQQLLNPPIVDHAGQTVAGEKERVANACIAVKDIGLDLIGHADATSDNVALWVAPRLLGSEEAGIDLLLDQRMILGELAQHPVAYEIDSRIADMTHKVAGLRQQKRRYRAAHSELVALGACPLVDCAVGVPQGAGYALVRIVSFKIVQVGELVADHLHGHFAGDLARCVSAHAVRDDEEPAVCIGGSMKRVLISLANPADISASRNSEVH